MKEFIQALAKFFRIRSFVFDFDYYDGTETDNNHVISDENVYQYEFRNQGETIVRINDYELQPGENVVLNTWDREKDVQVYKYDFINVIGFTAQVSETRTAIVPGAVEWIAEMVIGGTTIFGPVHFRADQSTTFIERLFNNALAPQFVGIVDIVILGLGGGGLQYSVSNIPLPLVHSNFWVTYFTSPSAVLQIKNDPKLIDVIPLEERTGTNKLLVISKLPGKRVKTNRPPP